MTTATVEQTQNDVLKERGILPQCKRAGWRKEPHFKTKAPGWMYPVWQLDGTKAKVQRWKSVDPDHSPKYRWDPPKAPDRPRYYALPGLKAAIAEADGEVHLAAGEVDVLTFHAAGIQNVLCWFGEGSVPKTLAADLADLAVKQAFYYPDRDVPGYNAAEKVSNALYDQAIELTIRQPDRSNAPLGYDVNDHWQFCGFNRFVFQATLEAFPVLNFPAPKPAPKPSTSRNGGHSDLFADYAEMVEREAIARWHIAPQNADGYSREHFRSPVRGDDENPSAQWNYQTKGFRDFGTDTFYNTQAVASLLDLSTYDDYKTQHKPIQTSEQPPRKPQNGHEPPGGDSKPERRPVPIVSTTEARARLRSWINGEAEPEGEPFLSPFTVLQIFGGLSRIHEARKVGLVIGASGTGKTSFCETHQDGACIKGLDWVAWGPEWTPEEYEMRRVAGWKGPSVEAQMYDKIWQKEKARGVPESKREGKPLTPDQRAKVNNLLDWFDTWPGQGHFIDTAAESLSYRLEAAGKKIEELRKSGRRVLLGYHDYAQKEPFKGDHWAEVEYRLGQIWQFAADYGIFMIVVSQVTKATANRVQLGELLGAGAGQSLSDQKANVVWTLNPIYEKDKDTNDSWLRTEKAWLRIVKNSLGAYPAQVKVRTALYRHRWSDKLLSGLMKTESTDAAVVDQHDEPPISREKAQTTPLPVDFAGY